LEQATGLAQSNSPLLRQSRAKVEQAQGLAVQAGLYPNPQQNSGNPNQLGGDNSLYSVGFSQEVVRAGKPLECCWVARIAVYPAVYLRGRAVALGLQYSRSV